MIRERKYYELTKLMLLVLFFQGELCFCQEFSTTSKANISAAEYGKRINLTLNESQQFPDGLLIELVSFSHKKARVGGPTKATAYLTVSLDTLTEKILLSVHGADGTKKRLEYSRATWNKYTFHLKELDYEKAIELIVEKK